MPKGVGQLISSVFERNLYVSVRLPRAVFPEPCCYFVLSATASEVFLSLPAMAEAEKTVLIGFLGRNRPVQYVGSLENFASATKVAFRDVLGGSDPVLFFQLRNEDWGGLFIHVTDPHGDIPDRSVLKAVVATGNEPVSLNFIYLIYAVLSSLWFRLA